MSQTQTARSPRQWCDALQAKLMDALDEAWRLAESSDDPAVQARAREKARLCGHMAATARKIAAMTPPERRAKAGPGRLLDLIGAQAETPPEPQPRAAQAVAMRAALRKLKRR